MERNLRRGRLIAPTADLSALGQLPPIRGLKLIIRVDQELSRLFFWITFPLYNTDAQLEGSRADRACV